MTLEVEVAGRTRTIAARRGSAGWIVNLDGREVSVDIVFTGRRWSLLVGPVGSVSRASHEVTVEPRGPGQRVLHVDGRAVPVTIRSARERFGRRHEHQTSAADGYLSAPMPGRVVRIFVKPGDDVTPGQPVAVVEAMKMENEIRAQRRGTVAEVRAREGMSIEAHAVLVVVE